VQQQLASILLDQIAAKKWLSLRFRCMAGAMNLLLPRQRRQSPSFFFGRGPSASAKSEPAHSID
jgi:hypothetical protein